MKTGQVVQWKAVSSKVLQSEMERYQVADNAEFRPITVFWETVCRHCHTFLDTAHLQFCWPVLTVWNLKWGNVKSTKEAPKNLRCPINVCMKDKRWLMWLSQAFRPLWHRTVVPPKTPTGHISISSVRGGRRFFKLGGDGTVYRAS